MTRALSLSPSLRVFTLTAVYAALLFLIVPYHEVWRDEMHDLSMVMSWKSLPDLFQNTSRHGFPALWYLVLFFGYHLTHSVLVLKAASILFVTVAVYLFLRFAPFSGFEKFLFPLGTFPLYEYSIISRSYGLSLMLVFGLCTFYPRRFQNLLPLAGALFLLANTNAHSMILTLALLACLCVQSFTNRSSIQNPKLWFSGLGLMVAGIFLALLQLRPDPASVVKYYDWTKALMTQAWIQALIHPGLLFSKSFGFPPEFLSLSLGLFYLASFRKNFSTGLFFFLSALGLSLFFLLIYPGAPRHQGFLFLAMVAALWMERSDVSKAKGNDHSFLFRYRNAFFLVLLVMQMTLGLRAVANDLAWPYSSSGDFAAFLRRDPKLREAILVPEPDYLAESLPFYAQNPIYLTREHRFGHFIHYTTANDAELSLGSLLDTAKRLQQKHRKPVLLMMGHQNLNAVGPFAFSFSYGKIFRYSPEERQRLQTETIPLTQFRDALSDENYDIYQLKG